MKISATPGVVIIEPLTHPKSKSSLSLTTTNPTRIFRGKAVSVGDTAVTKFGATIKAPCKVGDQVIFLSYEGKYDEVLIDNKKYFTVEFLDIRAVLYE